MLVFISIFDRIKFLAKKLIKNTFAVILNFFLNLRLLNVRIQNVFYQNCFINECARRKKAIILKSQKPGVFVRYKKNLRS